MKEEIDGMIATVEAKIATMEAEKQLLGDLLDTLRATRNKIDKPSPSQAQELARTWEKEKDFERFIKISKRRNTQFAKICALFVNGVNRPKTIADIANEIGTSKSSIANIIYRTQRGAFLSRKVQGEPRLQTWNLHPGLYEKISGIRQK